MARISTRSLAQLCRRLAVSLEAGVDVRRVWEKEAQSGGPAQRQHAAEVSRRINTGETLADAMSGSRGFYPSLVCEMVRVGEESGRMERVFLKLAEHYDHLLELRRTLLAGLALPLFELAAAIGIVGLLIIVTAMLGLDPFGLGISGMPLFALYVTVVLMGIAAVTVPVIAVQRGWLGTAPLAVAMKIPVIGGCLRMLALSRMAWSLAMAIDAGMEVQRSVRLALQSTQNPYYISHVDAANRTIERGGEINEALRGAGDYPAEFLDVLTTGELTGQVSESMVRLSEDYRRRVEGTLRILAVLGGVLALLMVALFIASLIIFMFMRVMMPYYQMLDEI
jgi:type II secretory pathway component PulF